MDQREEMGRSGEMNQREEVDRSGATNQEEMMNQEEMTSRKEGMSKEGEASMGKVNLGKAVGTAALLAAMGIMAIVALVPILRPAELHELSAEKIEQYQKEGYVSDDRGDLYRDEYKTVYALESLGLDKDLHGKTFLAVGHLESEPAYVFYYHTEDGGYELGRIPAEDCRIYYIEDDSQPHIDRSMGMEYVYISTGQAGHYPSNYGPEYKIYVPEGSIVGDYELDVSKK